jgi:hypothetical protein
VAAAAFPRRKLHPGVLVRLVGRNRSAPSHFPVKRVVIDVAQCLKVLDCIGTAIFMVCDVMQFEEFARIVRR